MFSGRSALNGPRVQFAVPVNPRKQLAAIAAHNQVLRLYSNGLKQNSHTLALEVFGTKRLGCGA